MYTSRPSGLTATLGLSCHARSPKTDTGCDHVCPWSEDREKNTWKPFIHTATTSPLSGTTSISGSN
jgi:hypothetical protein